MLGIRLSEEASIVNEIMTLLTEGDSRLKKAENIIRNAFKGILNVDGPVSGSEYYVNGNPNTTWGQYLMFNLRHTFGLMSNSDVKYIPVVAQLAYSNEVRFDMTNDNGNEIALLIKFVNLFKSDEGIFNKVKSMPNLTFNAVKELLLPVIQQSEKEANERMDNSDYGGLRTDYKIIEDADFETAERIGAMSCPNSMLCYTEKGNGMWDSTTQDGKNKCYILLKNGYESIEPRHSEPLYDFLPWDAYDEYGLSMIFLFLTPENDIYTANTRWNHSADYGKYSVDHAFDKESLSKIMGQSFNSLFKGYTKEELKEKGVKYIKFDEVQGLLDSGEKPEDIFDEVGYFDEGFARVKLNNRYNLIDTKGNLLWKGEWFDWVWPFEDGLATVKLNDKYNFIDLNGNLLWNDNEWFDWVGDFKGGFVRVKFKGKYNFLDTEGKILWKGEWFDWMGDFEDGFARIKLNNKWNFLDTKGNLLWKGDEWFDNAYFLNHDFAMVRRNNKFNFIDREGNLLWKGKWFDAVNSFCDGFVRVQLNGSNYLLDTNGKLHNMNESRNSNRIKNIIREEIYKIL